ncbi:protein IWS1-like protein [Gossypium australe]|uniref:Protein IWS1-like protein n=1 Tax=Gossypium australe TaxID=47621 RepID=A0A5B6WJ27_9ROSI|nr:protein IWS1-like protein [Gossypium australe]
MEEETNNIREIVQHDFPKTNKRKLQKPSDRIREEMWGWINSDGQDQKDEQIYRKSDTDAEIEAMFDKVKRRKKMEETSSPGIGLLVEKVMAQMEVAAEEDIELNSQNKPAIRKIQMLPLLTDFLSKKKLQQEFLDHGVLTLLKSWLDPLPDGSLPNATLRSSILNILTQVMPVDISLEDGREQLKKSGLGRAIMFLSKSDEETTANRELAKHLVQNWCRTIFNKTTSYSDLRNSVIPRMKKPLMKQSTRVELREAELDLEGRRRPCSSGTASGSVSVPEPAPCVYEVNPLTNFKPEFARRYRRSREVRESKCFERIEKKMRRLKKSNKKTLQAAKPAVRYQPQ